MERSELDYRSLFDASPNPYVVLDRALNIVGANRAYLEATKRELDDIVGRWAWDAFPTDPQTLRVSVESFERVIRERRPDTIALLRFDIPRPPAEGGGFEPRYWSLVHTPVFDQAGEVRYVVQQPIDVTELQRLRSEAQALADTRASALAASHSGIFERAQVVQEANWSLLAELDRLRGLFEQAPGFMVLLQGPEHVFARVNAAYHELVGKRELLGKPLRQALPELADQPFPALLDEVRRTGRPYVGRGMRTLLQRTPGVPPEERYVDFVYQPLTDADGRIWGIFAQGHDVTEQHRAAAALREANERQQLILQSSSMGTWHWELASGWVELSAAALRAYGLPSSPASTQAILARVHPDDAVAARACIAAAGDPAGSGQLRLQHRIARPDGTIAWVDVAGQVQFGASSDGARRAVRAAGVSWDITEQQRLVETLREADARKNEFLATLAHELRNPLAPLRNVASLLKRSNLDPAQRPLLEIMERQVGQLRRLVEDLLEVSRITQGKIVLKRAPVLVGSAAYAALEAVQPLIEQRAQRLEVRVTSGAVIELDAARITQVITNLLNNAAKFSPEGGTIALEAFDEPDAVVVRVIDHGVGIAREMLPRVFDLFAQGSATTADQAQAGLGIGLSLVWRLVELHGGTVAADSAGPGHGSVFTVRLPRQDMANPS